MKDVIKTSSVSIPSVALAVMAQTLAQDRVYGMPDRTNWEGWTPVERDRLSPEGTAFPAAREYYRIIDRISAGEVP